MNNLQIKEFSKEEINTNAKVLSTMFYDLDPKRLKLIGESLNILARTKLWPMTGSKKKGYKPLDRQQAYLFAAYGSRLKMAVLDSLYSFYVINGRITLYGKIGKALIWKSGQCKRLEVFWNEEEQRAYCIMQRVGSEHPSIVTFSRKEAEIAGLWIKEAKNSLWLDYPHDGCGWRAFWRNASNVFPDIICGMYGYEEFCQEEKTILTSPAIEEETQENTIEEQEADKELTQLLYETASSVQTSSIDLSTMNDEELDKLTVEMDKEKASMKFKDQVEMVGEFGVKKMKNEEEKE